MDLYLEYTKDVPSPEVFRLWTAIHAIGAAAERRLWTSFGINRLYPNLFVFLVGPPGTGKTQALAPMSTLLRKSQAVELAPNDLTKQGLLDALHGAAKGAMIEGRPFDYHFLALVVTEMSNFMSKYDVELTGILTELFDCPPTNEEKKRSGAGKMIPAPGISFIMGTATENLGSTIPQEAWGSGFMARVIMVFAAEEIIPLNMFEVLETNDVLAEEISTALRRIGEMKGDMTWTPGAQALLLAFRLKQKDGAPIHNRLAHYVTRRWLHLAKLCMVAALSDERQEVEEDDYALAMTWMLAAEKDMPEVFKDMVQHEDGQIYEELKQFVFHLWSTSGRKSIEGTVIYKFLSKRVSSYSIDRMIEVAIAADYIRRVAGTGGFDAEYVPGDMMNGTKDHGKI